MTDRELLELAAKAAGITLHVVGNGYGGVTFYTYPDMLFWNPLTDDGDALRLAVKLGLCILCHATQVEYSKGDGGVGVIVEQKFRDAAATRRAIVRAAAEIGKGV